MQKLVQSLIKWEWLILLLILPLLLLPPGRHSVVLLVVPILWLLRKIGWRRFMPATALDVALLALLSMVLVSFVATFNIVLSFPKIAGLVAGIAIFYAAVSFTRYYERGIWYLLTFFLVAGFAIGALGLLAGQWGAPLNRIGALWQASLGSALRIPGAVGGVINPNELAGTLDWIAPLATACLLGFWRPLWRRGKLALLLLAGLVGFTVLVLLATQSRGGVAGLAAALLVMLAIRFSWGRWLAVAILLATAAGLAAFGRFNSLIEAGTSLNELGLQARLEIWSRALYGIADFPLTGMSMNGFREVVHVLYPLFSLPAEVDLGHAHNHLLQAALDLGIPGLAAYLALWLVSAGLLRAAWKRTDDSQYRVLIVGLSGSLVAGWIFGMLDAISLGARPGFMWWLLLAQLVAVADKALASASQRVAAAGSLPAIERSRLDPEAT